MAPATRRSSGLGSFNNSPSNLDHVLEHFNQFKRKHVTQNRDIIKTNALAQLRIKELEDKILLLERGQMKRNAEIIHLRSKLGSAREVIGSIKQGWQLIGQGLSALTGDDVESQFMSSNNILDRRRKTVPPSSRITIDPNVLPGGVARIISRAPEVDLVDVQEENSGDLTTIDTQNNLQIFDHLQSTAAEETTQDEEQDMDLQSDIISFTAEGEDTIRITAKIESPPPLQQINNNSGNEADESIELLANDVRNLHRMTSMDSLSSFADDDEVDFSTDDETSAYITSRQRSFVTTNKPSPLSIVTIPDDNQVRKRKNPSSPEDTFESNNQTASTSTSTNGIDRSSAIEADEEYSQSESDSPHRPHSGRASRRSSMRDRKSVNYALPKLNTKMRKPDPIDLIPAVRSEERKPKTDEEETYSQSEAAIASGGGSISSSEPSPQKRMLKGKHEVASTGNLREIRKHHQQRLVQQQQEQLKQDESEGTFRAEQQEDKTPIIEERKLPRKKSSRTLLRRRSSSATPNELESKKSNDEESVETTSNNSNKEVGAVIATPAKWKSIDNSISRSFPSTSGTPIPKPNLKIPTGQTNNGVGIKALSKVANRMQPKSSSSLNIQQQKRIASAPLSTINNGNSMNKVLSNAIRVNANGGKNGIISHQRSASSGSSVQGPSSSSSSSILGNSGDPSKRNSLHAAFTSPSMINSIATFNSQS